MSKLSELKSVEQQVTQWLSQMGWQFRVIRNEEFAIFTKQTIVN